MRQLYHLIRLHLKVGYVLALSPIYGLLLMLAVVDVLRAVSLNVDPSLALSVQPTGSQILSAAGAMTWLILFLPALLAPFVAHSQFNLSWVKSVLTHSKIGNAITVLIIALNVLLFLYLLNFQTVAGLEVSVKPALVIRPAFHSSFLWVMTRLGSWGVGAIVLVYGILTVTAKFFGRPKWHSFSDYLRPFHHHSLPAQFIPEHGRNVLNFNSAGLTPTLRGIGRAMIRDMRVYQAQVPGTTDARDYLVQAWTDCKTFLSTIGIVESAGRQIRLFATTSRALDQALAELPNRYTVVLSPYEHPTEHHVALASGRQVVPIYPAKGFFNKTWNEQKSEFVERASKIQLKGESRGVIFVISEVCWATGFRIPQDKMIDLITDLQTACNRFPCHFVLDGAHAVGNGEPPYPTEICDAYIFCGHKWLLAPEPCGFLMSKHAKPVYDAWVSSLPVCAVGSATICGLRAALQLVAELAPDIRKDRVPTLQQELLTHIQEKFVQVGNGSGLEPTRLMSLKPRVGLKWKYPVDELPEALASRRLSALVIEPAQTTESKTTWIRLSLPIYSERCDMTNLAELLTNLAEQDT